MNKKIFRTIIILVVIANFSELSAQPQVNYAVNKSVLGNGGQKMQNSTHKLNGTLGQSIIGLNSNSTHHTKIGFWYKVSELATEVEQNSYNLPEKCELHQNYPNPFNQSTAIKYSIPKVCSRHTLYVRLVVYNLLGNEIAVLVSEQQQHGTYDAKWDASNNPHGVYFYKLVVSSGQGVTNNFVKTKKMILIQR